MSDTAGIKRCVEMLRAASSDTDKFAALLLATKLVNAADCGPPERKQLFDAIGFSFLLRMLSSPAPPGCPTEMFRSIALTILSCFCQDESVASSAEMAQAVPLIADTLLEAGESDEQLLMTADGYRCLEAAGTTAAGRQALMAPAPLRLLVETVAESRPGAEAAWRLLRSLLSVEGAAVWRECPELFTRLAGSLAMDLRLAEPADQPQLCRDLRLLVLSAPSPLPESAPDVWQQPLYQTLSDLLRAKLAAEPREAALLLTAALVERLGIRHCVLEPEHHRLFTMMYTNMFCIEVRMSLEDHSLAEVLDSIELLTASFLIIEDMFEVLISDSTMGLDSKQRQQLIVAMRGACGAVTSFLGRVMSEDMSGMSRDQVLFICGCVRIVLAWLAEETSYPDDVLELVPFLLRFCTRTFQARSQQAQSDMPDLMRLFLPALCHLTADDRARQLLLAFSADETLVQYFYHRWEMSASRLTTPLQAAELFQPVEDQVQALITLCSCLMNLAVMEADRVSQSALFLGLQRFIVSHLSDVDQSHLVLHSNLTVLGLLLVHRHAAAAGRGEQSQLTRFVQAAVRFLWDAHNTEDSVDQRGVVVATRYRGDWGELKELWFLGVQVLSQLLAQLAWLPEFLLETGWPAEIVAMLGRVRYGLVDEGLLRAYECFLLALAQQDSSAREALLAAGGEAVCRTHRLRELAALLKRT